MFDFKQYLKTVYTTRKIWEEESHTNLITFDDEEHNEELNKHVKLNSIYIPETKEKLIVIVKKY